VDRRHLPVGVHESTAPVIQTSKPLTFSSDPPAKESVIDTVWQTGSNGTSGAVGPSMGVSRVVCGDDG